MIPGRHRSRRCRGATAAAAAMAMASSLIAVIATAPAASGAPVSCPWVRSSAPLATRVSELLGQMTLDDKLAMVDGVGGGNGTAGYPGQIAANPGLCTPR